MFPREIADLNGKHRRVGSLLSAGYTVMQVAELTGVPHRTIYDWLNIPVFKEYVRSMNASFEEETRLSISFGMKDVDAFLKETVKNKDNTTTARISAARTLAWINFKYKEADAMAKVAASKETLIPELTATADEVIDVESRPLPLPKIG